MGYGVGCRKTLFEIETVYHERDSFSLHPAKDWGVGVRVWGVEKHYLRLKPFITETFFATPHTLTPTPFLSPDSIPRKPLRKRFRSELNVHFL